MVKPAAARRGQVQDWLHGAPCGTTEAAAAAPRAVEPGRGPQIFLKVKWQEKRDVPVAHRHKHTQCTTEPWPCERQPWTRACPKVDLRSCSICCQCQGDLGGGVVLIQACISKKEDSSKIPLV